MKLALIFGTESGNSLKPKLMGLKDNLNIDTFDSVPQFIDMSLKRNAIYDRIIVLSKKLNTKNLPDLHSYWSSTSKDTEVVLFGGKNDTEVANAFLSVFMTPMVAAMLLSKTTTALIAEAVLLPTVQLNEKYGVANFLSVEVESDSAPVPEPPKEPEKPQNPVQQKPVVQEKPKKKGFGFLSGLFGKKKSEEPAPLAEDEYYEDEYYEDEENYGNYESNNYYESSPVIHPNTPRDAAASTESYSSENDELYQEEEPVEANDGFEQDTNVAMPESSSVINCDVVMDSAGSLGNQESMEEIPDDFAPDTDIDFGDTGAFFMESESNSESGGTSEVEESFESIDINSAEEEYHLQEDAPKVVTQTQVREVVRNKSSKLNVLNGVYSGRLKKVVVVTGDRGSGVTSTALTIAKTLAKKVPVLYFDCDTDNHGILNYIDYADFKNYENTHMNGVKLCKSSTAFDRCVVPFEENFYLLTSDFSCEASDDDIGRTSEVVAERATDFGVVVVDCPVSKLHLISELILTCQGVICTEGSKRGFMNMLCQFESSTLPTRYKRTLVSRGTMLVTKCHKSLDLKALIRYIRSVFEKDDVDWLDISTHAFNGKLLDALLNEILEG